MIIRIKQAAKYLGLKEQTIRNKCHLGQLPYFKRENCNRLYFIKEELKKYKEGGRLYAGEEEREQMACDIINRNENKRKLA